VKVGVLAGSSALAIGTAVRIPAAAITPAPAPRVRRNIDRRLSAIACSFAGGPEQPTIPHGFPESVPNLGLCACADSSSTNRQADGNTLECLSRNLTVFCPPGAL